MATHKSRVHPNHKTRYRVTNWPEYDRGLVERGSLPCQLVAVASSAGVDSGVAAFGVRSRVCFGAFGVALFGSVSLKNAGPLIAA